MTNEHTIVSTDADFANLQRELASLDGYGQLQAMLTRKVQAPIAKLMSFKMVTLERGHVVMEAMPDRTVYNPIGTVHGGYSATLLDSACGLAVHSNLKVGQNYTTLELKIAYHRTLSDKSGPVRVEGLVKTMGSRAAFAEGTLVDREGRLCASATSTLLVFDYKPPSMPVSRTS